MFGTRKKQQALLEGCRRDMRRIDLKQARAIANQLDAPRRSERLAQIAEEEQKLNGGK